MAITFTQTDTNSSVCNSSTELAACSGRTGGVNSAKVASVGGTAGTVAVSETAVGSASNVVECGFALTIPAGTTGDSGTWTTRLNITTANMNLTITEIHVCRANSSCTNQESIGSATGLSISLGSTGVKSQNVTGGAVTLAADDLVTVVYVISNGAMTDQTFQYTPNQNIDSPFTTAVFTPAANKYRFYDDDGAEDASTPLANEDTNVTINVDSGNVPFQLRYRLQEGGGAAGAATDDYDLQRSLNSGGYSTITGATTAIITSTSGLTNDGATTNRATNGITDGTGSFVAGEQSTDGVLDNWQLTASNYSEIVYGGTVVAADVNNNDTIDFRVTLNGGTPGMTNSVTPRITIQKTPPTTTQFFMLLGVGT